MNPRSKAQAGGLSTMIVLHAYGWLRGEVDLLAGLVGSVLMVAGWGLVSFVDGKLRTTLPASGPCPIYKKAWNFKASAVSWRRAGSSNLRNGRTLLFAVTVMGEEASDTGCW